MSRLADKFAQVDLGEFDQDLDFCKRPLRELKRITLVIDVAAPVENASVDGKVKFFERSFGTYDDEFGADIFKMVGQTIRLEAEGMFLQTDDFIHYSSECTGQLTSVKVERIQTGYVYFLRVCYPGNEVDSLVKIGYTKNLDARFSQITGGLMPGFHASFEYCLVSDNPKDTEAWLHSYFSERRVAGEWFRITVNQIYDGLLDLARSGHRLVLL